MSKTRARSRIECRHTKWISLLVPVCCLWSAIAAGDIFRYQDEQGSWHFTDDPPERYESSIVPGITTSKPAPQPAGPADDLAGRLQSAYDPITPIAYATLAVVSIKTATGEASGFFCSEQGHILTNKHVVRPGSAGADATRDGNIESEEEKLRALDAALGEARGQLQLMAQDLEGYEDLIEDAREDDTRSRATDAHQRLYQRYREERSRISTMDRNVRALKSELRTSKREQSLERSFAAAKNQFDVILKDGTELVASLAKTSDALDLALLKVDGYLTPFLRLDPSTTPSQGTRVFAIGSPLGMQDAVTSGVVTQVAPDHLLTDAQILPGSSGGPLIRESGEVIGINVSRRVAAGTSKYSAGFGKAIPIALALQEFPEAIASVEVGPFDPGQQQLPDSNQTWSLVPDGAGGFDARRVAAPAAGQTWTFGPEGAMNVDPNRPLLPERGQPGGFNTDQAATMAPREDGLEQSAPVRLIIPGSESGVSAEQHAKPEPRSLDFPPEGGGIPPGISQP